MLGHQEKDNTEMVLMELLVDKIEEWGKVDIENKEKLNKRDFFIKFLEKLCLIKSPLYHPFTQPYVEENFLKYHREYLLCEHSSCLQLERWDDVSACLENESSAGLKDWARKEAVSVLRPSLLLDIENINSSKALELIQMEQDRLKNEREINDENIKKTEMAIYQDQKDHSPSAWSNEEFLEIQELFKIFFDSKKYSSKIFLEFISSRLLQLGNIDNLREVNERLNAHLFDAFEQYIRFFEKNKQNEIQQNYWGIVIKSLIILGGNPLSWIKHNQETASACKARLLVVQQASIVFSNMVYCSKNSGEVITYLREDFLSFHNNLKIFSDLLYECEESLWRRFCDFFREKLFSKKECGGRDERACILWTAIGWVYCLLNEEKLHKQDSSIMKNAYDNLQKTYSVFEQLMDEEKQDDWIKDAGKAYSDLKTSISRMEDKAFTIMSSRDRYKTEKLADERIEAEVKRADAYAKQADAMRETLKDFFRQELTEKLETIANAAGVEDVLSEKFSNMIVELKEKHSFLMKDLGINFLYQEIQNQVNSNDNYVHLRSYFLAYLSTQESSKNVLALEDVKFSFFRRPYENNESDSIFSFSLEDMLDKKEDKNNIVKQASPEGDAVPLPSFFSNKVVSVDANNVVGITHANIENSSLNIKNRGEK